jgi:enoyl-CoA hydratase/carnithine racemase
MPYFLSRFVFVTNYILFIFFQEVDIGIVADVGTLQRLPKIVASQSVVRELCYTGRMFCADEAKAIGAALCLL